MYVTTSPDSPALKPGIILILHSYSGVITYLVEKINVMYTFLGALGHYYI